MKNFALCFIMTMLLSITTGCAPILMHQDPELANAASLVQQKKYADAIESYRKMLNPQTPGERDATARYALGLLHAFHDNPNRDYNQAVEAFDEFLRRYPKHGHVAEAQNWKATIRLIQEEAKEKEQLKKSINQLKQLDIRHEEKRKEIR